MHQCGPDHLHIVSLDPGTLFDHYTEYGYTLNGKYPWTLDVPDPPHPTEHSMGSEGGSGAILQYRIHAYG